MKVTVNYAFFDEKENCDRHAGEVFECTEARFKEIKAKLPEWVSGETTTKKTTRKTAKK